MNSNSFFLYLLVAVIQSLIFGVNSSSVFSSGVISETCGCFDIELDRGEVPDPPSDTTEFNYFFKQNDCKSSKATVKHIGFAIDNHCDRKPDEICDALTVLSDDATIVQMYCASDIMDSNLIPEGIPVITVDIKFKNKLNDGDNFQIIVGALSNGDLGAATKRANTRNNLIGFKLGKRDRICYTDVTYRIPPEICNPPPPPDSKFDTCGDDLNSCSVEGALCAENGANVGARCPDAPEPCTPCDDNSVMGGNICVEVRKNKYGNLVSCENDDDCKGQDRCFTLFGEDNGSFFDCTENVCGSSNFN